MTNDLDLAGLSRRSLAATPTGGVSHGVSPLKDVPPEESDGDPVHLNDQITPLEVTDPGTIEFDLSGIRHTVAQDHPRDSSTR